MGKVTWVGWVYLNNMKKDDDGESEVGELGWVG